MTGLTGDLLQRPPAYSAVKVGGRKLYEAARAGEELQANARPVHVETFEMTGRSDDDVDFLVVCGGGTYVRVLAADVGDQLGCGAHLTRLRRTAIGGFRVEDARPPEEPGPPLSLDQAVAHLPRWDVEEEEAIAVSHGRILAPSGLAGPFSVVAPDGRMLGIYEDAGTKAVPLVVLAPAGRTTPGATELPGAPTPARRTANRSPSPAGSAIPARPRR